MDGGHFTQEAILAAMLDAFREDVAAAIAWAMLACPNCQPAAEKLRELQSTAECLQSAEKLTGRPGADAILRRVGQMLTMETAALRQ